MKAKIIMVAALWAVFVFTVSAVWHMFGRPVDYMAFVFWAFVIALAFGPAAIMSHQLAEMVVNPDGLDPEVPWHGSVDEQLDRLRDMRADAGVVFYDDDTYFLFGPDDLEGFWWIELIDSSEGKPAVMDRVTVTSRGGAFMWIERTAFTHLDGNTDIQYLKRNLQVV